MADKHKLDRWQLLGLVIGGVGLLYAVFHKSKISIPTDTAGATPPVLIGGSQPDGTGTTGGSGGQSYNPLPSFGPLQLPAFPVIDIPGITIPANPAVDLGGFNVGPTVSYTGGNTTGPTTIGGSLVNLLLGGGNSGGCCGQFQDVPYTAAAPAMTASTPLGNIASISPANGYQLVTGTSGENNDPYSPSYFGQWDTSNQPTTGQWVLGNILGGNGPDELGNPSM
jgi:hypothetical protein